jgi:hypothetical protein
MKAWPFLVGALVLAIAACSRGADLGDQQALAGQSAEPTRTLAVASPAPTATAKPKATPKAKATSKPRSSSYYKPPNWDGYSDLDCKDFDTQAHAQSFFQGTGGSTSNDPYRLDSDHDAIACESI